MCTCAIFGAASASCLLSVILYKLIKSRTQEPSSCKVDCWFCGTVHVVPSGNRNCWDCSTCEQFNGFDESGDYVKPIPAQYDEYLNAPILSSRHRSSTMSADIKDKANGLCAECNRNQLIKIKQLASFVPCFEDRFEDEVYAYERQIESSYPLCVSCQAVVRRKLNLQDASLLPVVQSWKRQRYSDLRREECAGTGSHHRPVEWYSSLSNLPIKAQMLRFLSSMVVVMLFRLSISGLISASGHSAAGDTDAGDDRLVSWTRMFLSELTLIPFAEHFELLAIVGFFCLIISIFISGREKLRPIDAVASFAWLVLLFSHLAPVENFLTSVKARSQLLFVQGFFSLTCVPVILYGSVCRRAPVNCRRSWRGHDRSNSGMSALSDDADLSPSSWTRNAVQDDGIGSSTDVVQDGLITTTTTIPATNSKTPAANEVDVLKSRINLDDGLQALKIGTPKKIRNSVSGIFTPRSYNHRPPTFEMTDPDHCAAFQREWRLRRSFLVPTGSSKSSAAYSSWVSGGYFSCRSVNTRPFGRGQSHGGFQSHSCPVSRAGSVQCEDRLSVFSDPGEENGLTHNRQRLLLSKCKFNPFETASPDSIGTAPSSSIRSGTFAVDRQSSSSDTDDEKDVDVPSVSTMDKGSAISDVTSVGFSSGLWKRPAVCFVLVTSLAINMLLLIYVRFNWNTSGS